MRVKVIPKPGRIVRDPGDFFRQIPAEGKVVELDAYFERRRADGDIDVLPADETAAAEDVSAEEPALRRKGK